MSQRSESMNAYFDGFINANTKLIDFVNQYDKAVIAHRALERREDYMTLHFVSKLCLSHLIEKQVSKLYTRSALKIFQDEMLEGLTLFHEEASKEATRTIYVVGDPEKDKKKMGESDIHTI